MATLAERVAALEAQAGQEDEIVKQVAALAAECGAQAHARSDAEKRLAQLEERLVAVEQRRGFWERLFRRP